jgi:hypothetical protein
MIRVRSDSRALVAAEAATPGWNIGARFGRIRMGGALPRTRATAEVENAHFFAITLPDGIVSDL